MPKVMMISGAKALGSGDIGARGRVPVAGAYRSPIGRLIGHANLGAVHGSADAIRAGLMLPLLRGAGVGAMRSLNYPSAALHYPGAALRGCARSGLGGIDTCNDPGWAVVQGVMGAAAGAFGAAGTATGGAGWSAIGGAIGGAGTVWRGVCDAEEQRRRQAAEAAGGDPTMAWTLRREAELERLRQEADGQMYGRNLYNQPPPPAPAPAGVPNWVYYAGAAAGVGLLAYAVLGGKRRR